MLQVCPNGARSRDDCPILPVTPQELALSVRAAVTAGAQDVHVHPKDHEEEDTVEPEWVARAVGAVREAVPGTAVGVTTGAWACPDPEQRARLVRSWTVLPDHASVNWHEEGAELVADALLEQGIGIEAGIFSGTDAIQRFFRWPSSDRVLRILAEVTDPDPRSAPDVGAALVGSLRAVSEAPILLHGEEGGAWPVLELAARTGLDLRIGFEDVLMLPDGLVAPSNAALVAAAVTLTGSAGGHDRRHGNKGLSA